MPTEKLTQLRARVTELEGQLQAVKVVQGEMLGVMGMLINAIMTTQDYLRTEGQAHHQQVIQALDVVIQKALSLDQVGRYQEIIDDITRTIEGLSRCAASTICPSCQSEIEFLLRRVQHQLGRYTHNQLRSVSGVEHEHATR